MYKTTNRFISAAVNCINGFAVHHKQLQEELTYVNPDSGTQKPCFLFGNVITKE